MRAWQDLGNLKICPKTLRGDARGPLPEGRAELEMVAALRQEFGGKDWRRICQTRALGQYGVETSATWKNEYGVEIEVMT